MIRLSLTAHIRCDFSDDVHCVFLYPGFNNAPQVDSAILDGHAEQRRPCPALVRQVSRYVVANGQIIGGRLGVFPLKLTSVPTANLKQLVRNCESGDALLMFNLCTLIWYALVGRFRSRTSLEAENLAFRHQLNILRRGSPKKLSNFDRMVFAGLYRLDPGTEIRVSRVGVDVL